MFVGVAGAAAPTAEAYEILIMSLVTVAAVIGLPVLLVVLIWRAASQSAQQRRQSQAAEQAAAAAAAASEQAAREAFLKPYLEWTDHSYSLFDKSFIAIDLSGRQIAVGVVGRATKYPFEAITAVDVVKDGGVLTLHQDKPTAPVLLQSPYFEVSALLKAIESPTNTVTTVRELALKLTVEDASTPVYEINFLHVFADTGLPMTDEQVISAGKRIDKFRGYIANALRDSRAAARGDAADEVKKLWDLKQAGALTDAEFDSQKAKLLSAGSDATLGPGGKA